MFWFAFISIILFILFLVVILVTTGRSSTDKTLRSLKDELEEKNRLLDEKKKKSKVKKGPRKRKLKPKVTEVVEEPISKETVTVTEEPQVKEEVFIQEEVEEVLTPPIEVSDAELEKTVTTLEEEIKVEALEKSEEVLEEPEIVKEDLEVEVEPSVEEIEEETVTEAVEPGTEVEPESPVIEEVIEVETPEVEVPTVEENEVVEETLEVPVEPLVEVEEEEPTPEPVETTLPYEYTVFDNARTMEEFGLSKEEADEFIVELITQVEDEMPALESAVEAHDAKQIEDISHMVKGSATNLGTGGIADVLIDFNTYMKSDNDPAVVAGHMVNLHRALKELKEQFQ